MVPFGLNELAEERGVNLRLDPGSGFNAFLVSEALWSEWTRVVRELKLGDERLGRVADSLKSMPTVIWSRTLGEYENLTLAEIRGLRTHGEKRVRCVLQVFHKVYEETQRSRHEGVSQLRRRLGSQRILAISSWIGQQLASHRLPSFNDVLKNLAEPILAQIEIDCGQTVHRIARQRLGVDAEAMSVRDQAHAMGVTRARVYQLLDDCHKVVEVRWPQGKQQLDQLTGKLGAHLGTQPEDASLFLAVRQLCFPDRSQPESRSQVHSSTRTSSAP